MSETPTEVPTETATAPTPPSFEAIAEGHLRRTGQWTEMTPEERTDLVRMRATEAREWIAATLPGRTPEPTMDETPQQGIARVNSARFQVQSEAIREFLLPTPTTGPTDPDVIEAREELRRLGAQVDETEE